ncbi:PD40 domain-containing protein [Anaerolinea thermolimosa]|uniref:PD40 domain-containing protein n=1 Tax=Anaerolinea thermolimosa TaxID=229919 RepID=UPI000782341C|nr:PD40 domain-containing protein [Anaerolinea thermolimosa]
MKSGTGRRLIFFLGGGLFLLLAVFWFGVHLLQPAGIVPGNGDGTIGVFGPFVVIFSSTADKEAAEASIGFEPPLTGEFRWDGSRVSFWPSQPLNVGEEYTVKVAGKSPLAGGQPFGKGSTRTFLVRSPQLLYLSPSDRPEIWRLVLDGTPAVQMTHTQGKIYDYAVDRSGEKILYSAKNDQGGISLWITDREGGSARSLLPCGEDICIQPSFSPFGDQLAYVRRNANGVPGSSPGLPRVWLMNLNDGSTQPLPMSPEHSGSNPAYSPDGKWLSYYDELAAQIHLVKLSTGEEVVLERAANIPATWTADSQWLYFVQVQQEETVTFNILVQWNADTRKISRVFPGEGESGIDEGPALFSPNGQWLAVRRAEIGHPESRIFEVMSNPGGTATTIAINAPDILGMASWSPDSAHLAFQVFRSGGSSATPAVRVWSQEEHRTIEVASDAMLPQWLP